MRCKTCDYPLWNLKARQCPECGTAFSPRDFEFVINSVRFCCPHCEQEYYGTGVSGHLVPDEFNCVRCGRRISMSEMVLRPAEGVQEQQTKVETMPWLERKQRGFVKAWFATVGKSMMAPNRLMQAVDHDSGVGQAWWYAAVTCMLALGLGIGAPLLVIGIFLLADGDPDAAQALLGGAGSVLGGTVTILGLVGVWGAVAHGILKITGGAPYPIGRTYQSILYSIGTCSPIGVPCIGPYCGFYLLWIWWIVSGSIMLKEGQRVHGGRATLAVLTFPGAMVLLFVAGYAILVATMIGSVTSARAQMGGGGTGAQMAEVSALSTALLNHRMANNGQWPVHAVELAADGGFGASNFIAGGSATIESDVPIADIDLQELQFLPVNRKRMAIEAAAEALPPNTVAHRVGDFVFTYHGITDATGAGVDPALWLVIWCEDPVANSGSSPARVVVGTAVGPRLFSASMASELAAQNRLRAQAGLPPLPDPTTVTHDAPAVSGP